MFNPATILAVAPRSAPIFSDIQDGSNLKDYLEGHRANNQTTQSALLAIILKLARTAESGEVNALTTNCGAMFYPGAAAALIAASTAAPVDVDNLDENEAMISMALTQVDIAEKWICDLVNGSKKKELTSDNVESYYSALGRSDVKGASLSTVINKVANFLPDLINNAAFRNSLTDNLWTTYHASRVSTGKVLFKIRQPLIDLGIIVAGDPADLAIINSNDNSHDVSLSYAIPEKIVGYGALFYEVSGVDLGKWRQGIKAEATLPAAKVKAIKVAFKKYLEIKNSLANVEDATTIVELNTAVGNDFW
jgi:hypothetical protein